MSKFRLRARWAAAKKAYNDPSSVPRFTCPKCGRTSYNRNDVAEGYCGRCHEWTGGRSPLEKYAEARLGPEFMEKYDRMGPSPDVGLG